MKQVVKRLLKSTLFRTGSIRTVIFGPCRGLKYRIFPGFGHAYLYGGWEPRETAFMIRLVHPGMVAYDLGANYGMHTLLLARLVGSSGKVYAFEPLPEVFNGLQEQVEMNGFKSTCLVQKAVADRIAMAQFDLGHCRAVGHLAENGNLEVEMTTLDHFVLNEGNTPPDFIKIDIEGAESKALLGARTVIQRFQPNMLIELHTPEQDKAVGAILQDLNYVVFRSKDGSRVRNLQSCWPDPVGMWGTVVALPAGRERLLQPPV